MFIIQHKPSSSTLQFIHCVQNYETNTTFLNIYRVLYSHWSNALFGGRPPMMQMAAVIVNLPYLFISVKYPAISGSVTQERHKPSGLLLLDSGHAKIISTQAIYLKMSLGFIFWFVCYLEVQFEGSAVPPQLTVSQSGPARNVSETRKSGLETPSHCCPLRDWIGTTTHSNGDNQ